MGDILGVWAFGVRSFVSKMRGVSIMSVRIVTSCMLLAGLVIAVGCLRGPSRVPLPSIDASAAGAKAIEQYDSNHDGKISGAELNKCPALKAAVAQIDTTGQGLITADKIAARIKDWQDKKMGLMTVTCTVLRNGQPLADAEVKFVPEKFLGDSVKTASGKTNQTGVASVSVPIASPDDRPGVAPGLYRVEISKVGDNIPPRYNANTTLGQEVAIDAQGIMHIIFGLKY
jgi:hypothetical protein